MIKPSIKTAVLGLTAAAIIGLAPVTASAQATNLATKIGEKVAEKIATAILGQAAGRAFNAIFGTGQEQVTLDEIKDAINSAFEKAEIADIASARQGLVNQVRDYNPDRNADQNLQSIDRIMKVTGDLQATVDVHINKQSSMTVIPAFVTAWNTRLAFATERYRLDKVESDKDAIATEAIFGLEALEKYMREEFADLERTDSPCVHKDKDTHLRLNGSEGSNISEKLVDVSTQYCFGNGRVLRGDLGGDSLKKLVEMLKVMHGVPDKAVVNLGGAWYMRSTDIGRARSKDVWLFAARMKPRSKDYFLYQAFNHTYAHALRNNINGRMYPQKLGEIVKLANSWIDVVKAAGDQDQLQSALVLGFKLGVPWETLRKHGNGTFNSWLDREIDLIKRAGPFVEIRAL